MADIETLENRLDAIEDRIDDRPGEAQDDLAALLAELDGTINQELGVADGLLRNEDFPGAARTLSESATLLQRIATDVLALREAVRRRR